MKIEICNNCKGEGKIRERADHYDSEYIDFKCSYCNGTGRVLVGDYEYEVSFDTDKKFIREIDSKIIELLRELQSKKLEVCGKK